MKENSTHTSVNLSYWEQTAFFRDIDVAIIGSGIVGLNASIHLKEQHPSLKVVILERGSLPIGASTRNAGFACFGSMTELLEDLKTHSEEEVFQLVENRWAGLNRLRERVGDLEMDYQGNGGFEIFKTEESTTYEACLERIDWMNRSLGSLLKQHDIFSPADHLIPKFGFKKVGHMIRNAAEGQIDTGKMMRALLGRARSLGVEIFNGFEVDRLEAQEAAVEIIPKNNWAIKAKRVLVANNGFAGKICELPDLQPARNQVLITKRIEKLPFVGTFHYDGGYFYFRNIDQRILLGGGRHLAKVEEQTEAFGTTELIRNALLGLLKEVVLPGQTVEVDMWWSGILGVGSQKKPIVQQVGPNIFTAVRLGGMGVAIGSLVGEEGADLILRNI